jgi:hypothetical protein
MSSEGSKATSFSSFGYDRKEGTENCCEVQSSGKSQNIIKILYDKSVLYQECHNIDWIGDE